MSVFTHTSSPGIWQHVPQHTSVPLCCITSGRIGDTVVMLHHEILHLAKKLSSWTKLKQLWGGVLYEKYMFSREALFHEHLLSIQTVMEDKFSAKKKKNLLALIPWFNLLTKAQPLSLWKEKSIVYVAVPSLIMFPSENYGTGTFGRLTTSTVCRQQYPTCSGSEQLLPETYPCTTHQKQKWEGLLQKSRRKRKPSPERWQRPERKQA